MPNTICERALTRTLAYLEWSGVELSHAVCLKVLALVEQVLTEAPDDPMGRIMDRLPEQFDPPAPVLPPVAPPLHRGSIGYRDN